MSSTLQFDDIYHGSDIGKIRLAASGMAWKVMEGERSVSLPVADLKWAQWLRVARNYQLRVGLKSDRRRETFDGFYREDHEALSNAIKQHYGITLETKEISLKGWNWGTTDFQGQDLAFIVSNKTAFEVQLGKVANSNIAGKTEVSLEFINADKPDAVSPQKKKRSGDELVEMRFYVPGTLTKDDEDEDGKAGGSDMEETSAAQAFHEQIKEKADIGQVTGEGIIVFNEVLVVTPRGRYDIDMFPTFLRLRGKTYDYKIAYPTITKLFLLPKGDDTFVQLIVGLDPPIRQGQTRYPFLVMHFSRDEEMDAELNLDEETIATKYEGKLEKKYDAPTFHVISSIFRALTGKKLITPFGFQSRDGQHGIKCNLKATQGELYFLEKSLIFVAKQPTLVDFADIHQAIFSRVGGGMASARTFDLKIVPKTGAEISFTSINKEEQDPVEDYLKNKKIRVKSEMADDLLTAPGAMVLSDEDEEMQSVASSGDEAPKPRLGNDDEDSSEDEDFQASGSDSGSPTDSSSDEEGGGAQSDASGDLELAKPKKSKGSKKKKPADGNLGSPPAKQKAAKKKPADSDAEMADPKPKTKSKSKPKPPRESDGEGPARKKQRKE